MLFQHKITESERRACVRDLLDHSPQEMVDLVFINLVGKLCDLDKVADGLVTFYPHWEEAR